MALAPGLDLRSALRETAERGAAFVPGALDEAFRRRLRGDVSAGPFVHFEGSFGPVRQDIDGFDVPDPMDGFPTVAELRDELTSVVRSHGRGVRGLGTWRPNEAGVTRYRPGSLGITPHLDGKWYRRLVAVATIWGRAPFSVCRTREGEVVASWETGPGDLVLMRAPGLAGHRDGRPFHTIPGPKRGERCSIAFRMDARG